MAYQTYTPPGGYSSQATATDQLNQALATIQGSIPQPSQIESQMQGVKATSPIPAATADMNKMFELYKYNQGLNQGISGTAPSLNAPVVAGAPGQTSLTMSDAMLPAKMTLENVNAPFSGFTDPALAGRASNLQVSGALKTIGNIGDLISKDYEILGKQLGDVASMYKSQLDAKQKAADQAMGLYKEIRRTGLTEYEAQSLALQAAKEGLVWDEKTKSFTYDLQDIYNQTGVTDPKIMRKQAQALYQKYPINSVAAKKIAEGWKIVHGNELFPKTDFSSKDRLDLQGTVSIYNTVQSVLNVMDKYPDIFPQGLMGRASEELLNMGAYGTYAQLIGKEAIPKEVQKAIGDLVKLRAGGERTMIGGRLTGYLLDRLASAFPGREKSIGANKEHLMALKNELENDLKIFSYSNSYDSPEDLVNQIGLNIVQPYTAGQTQPQTNIQTGTFGAVRLQSPTGETYEYDSSSDPDYVNDLKSGFKPV